MSTHDCNVTSCQKALPPRSNTEISSKEKKRTSNNSSTVAYFTASTFFFFVSAMTMLSHPRLPFAKTDSDDFTQIKFNKTVKRYTETKRAKWSWLSNLHVVILKSETLRRNNLWKIPREFVIPLAQEKQVFSTLIFTLKALGVFPPSVFFLIVRFSNYSSMLKHYTNSIIY